VFGIKFFRSDEVFLGGGIEVLRLKGRGSDEGECQEAPREELPDPGCDVTHSHVSNE
jgi:hypothetical protein